MHEAVRKCPDDTKKKKTRRSTAHRLFRLSMACDFPSGPAVSHQKESMTTSSSLALSLSLMRRKKKSNNQKEAKEDKRGKEEEEQGKKKEKKRKAADK